MALSFFYNSSKFTDMKKVFNMLKVKKFIKRRNSRNDLNILLKTFIIPQDEIWNGHIVHVINRIPLNEYNEEREPRFIGRICKIGEEQKSIEYIYIYKLAHWRLLVWKVDNHNSKNSKPYAIRIFYSKDYEIYIDGRNPTEEEELNGWNGKPEYYYNFKLDINDRFTIMGWKETQDFINKLIKDYDWIWDVRLDKEILV